MISNLLNFSLVGILFVDFIERRFPSQFQNFVINISYKCIYFYSKIQIFFVKYITSNPVYLKVIDIIKSKNTKNDLEFLFVKDNFHYDFYVDLFDFIITTDLSKTPTLKKITYSGNYKDVVFEESDIKFLLIEFKVGDKSYKINLKTDIYNYYIVGNKFTKDFFIFYINKYILTKYEQHEINNYEKYILKIIDHNVNIVEVKFTNENESILLDKDSYKLNIIKYSN